MKKFSREALARKALEETCQNEQVVGKCENVPQKTGSVLPVHEALFVLLMTSGL
jgi:hypothetical protein